MNKRNNKRQHLSTRIGSMIKHTRKEKGMTQVELAERLGTQQPSIARIESGEFLPNLSFLKKVADCLGVEVEIGFKSEFVSNTNMRR